MSAYRGKPSISLTGNAVAGQMAARRHAVRPLPLLGALGVALVCVALGLAFRNNASTAGRSVLTVAASHHYRQQGVLSLPAAAQAPVSAALGEHSPAYRVTARTGGFQARSPEQQLALRFSRSGVSVRSHRGVFALALRGIGRGTRMRPIGASEPTAAGNRVSYSLGSDLREWYSNGPLGLEQGFDVEAAPSGGSGPLTLSLAVSGNLHVRLVNGGVSLTGHGVDLRYAGLSVRDAHGRKLPAWLELRHHDVLLRIADRRALYPLHVDPWVQSGELTGGDATAGAQFGYSVAVSGNTVVVGAPHTNNGQGAVYVFTRGTTGWAQTAELTPGDPDLNANFPGKQLGYSVAISGSTIVAGAPYWSSQTVEYQGAVYVWTLPKSGVWANATQTAMLSATDLTDNYYLGTSVAVQGSTIVAGAPEHLSETPRNGEGAVYVYTMPSTGGWVDANQNAELSGYDDEPGDGLGFSVAISGTTIVAGAPEEEWSGTGSYESRGGVYVWTEPTDGVWVNALATAELIPNDLNAFDALGTSVAISGSTIVAGAPFHSSAGRSGGAVYVWTLPPIGGWNDATQPAELTGTNLNARGIGESVAVSGGTIFGGGGPFIANVPGAVYEWTRPPSGFWASETQTATLTTDDSAGDDLFGNSMAISGPTLVTGASGANNFTGKAYVFGGGYTISGSVSASNCGDTCVAPTPIAGQQIRVSGTTSSGTSFSAVDSSDANGNWSVLAPAGSYTAEPVENDGVTPIGPAFDPQSLSVTVTNQDVPDQNFLTCGRPANQATAADARAATTDRPRATTGAYTMALCKADYTLTVSANIPQTELVDPALKAPYQHSKYANEPFYLEGTGTVAARVYDRGFDSILELPSKYPECFGEEEMKEKAEKREAYDWYTTMSGGSLGSVSIPLVWNAHTGSVSFASAPTESPGSLTRTWHLYDVEEHEAVKPCHLTAQISPVAMVLPGGADATGLVPGNAFTAVVLWYFPFDPGGEAQAPDTSAERLLKHVLGHENGELLVKAWESLPWPLRFGFLAGLGEGGVKGLGLLAHLTSKVKSAASIAEALELLESAAHKLHNAHSVWDVSSFAESVAGIVGLMGQGDYPIMATVLRGSFDTKFTTYDTSNSYISYSAFGLSVKSTKFPTIKVKITRQVQPNQDTSCPVGGAAQPLPWQVSHFGCPIVTNPFVGNPPYTVMQNNKSYARGTSAVDALIADTNQFGPFKGYVAKSGGLYSNFSIEQNTVAAPSCDQDGHTGGSPNSQGLATKPNTSNTICWVFKDGRP